MSRPSVADASVVVTDRHGRALALTTLTPIRWWGRWWLRLWFWIGRMIPRLAKPLMDLSFIHFARWSLIEAIPSGDRRHRLRRAHLYFESNYNGDFEQYLDTFSLAIAPMMWAVWGSSLGFPGARPIAPFKDYVAANRHPTLHFYSAYPEASSTMVTSALALQGEYDAFVTRARGLDAQAFDAEWQRFLTAVQRHL